jgi:ribosomal protein L7/L12
MVAELADKIANLTIAQAVELKNVLKEKYGIEPAGSGVMMAAASSSSPVLMRPRRPTSSRPCVKSLVGR